MTWLLLGLRNEKYGAVSGKNYCRCKCLQGFVLSFQKAIKTHAGLIKKFLEEAFEYYKTKIERTPLFVMICIPVKRIT